MLSKTKQLEWGKRIPAILVGVDPSLLPGTSSTDRSDILHNLVDLMKYLMAHGVLFLTFNFCLKSVLKPNKSLYISKNFLGKRSCPSLRLPAIRNSSEKRQPARNLRDETCTSRSIEETQLECTHHGCKPVYKEEDLTTSNGDCDNWVCLENASDIVRSRLKAYHDKLSHQETLASDSGAGSFYKDFAGYLNHVWMQKDLAKKYYGKALARESSNAELLIEYAEFVWKRLDSITMAAEVLEEALLLPDFAENVQVWGMYSYILWHRED
ncbi:hypothetical protein SUGI_0599750 [Cryptomeria japonica]|nr:hypothetical protein SUGI_0599750 [Cryptomeria japonica]